MTFQPSKFSSNFCTQFWIFLRLSLLVRSKQKMTPCVPFRNNLLVGSNFFFPAVSLKYFWEFHNLFFWNFHTLCCTVSTNQICNIMSFSSTRRFLILKSIPIVVSSSSLKELLKNLLSSDVFPLCESPKRTI